MVDKIISLLINPFFYTPLIGIAGAIIGSWFTYIFSLRRFHREKQYQNKLDRYLILVDRMKGFVNLIEDEEVKKNNRIEFANSYRTIWLYGSAKVVRSVSKFLNIVLNPPKSKEDQEAAKEKALKILKQSIIAMREDLKAKGRLKEDDFGIYF